MIPQLQRETAAAVRENPPQWSLATRIGFRFVFSYFLLYLGPGAVGALGVRDTATATPYRDLWASIWHNLVPWVGINILHLQGNFREVLNGSGDELYDYVLVFCIAILAVIATAIWSWLDRERANYERLYAFLRVMMQLAVAAPMIGYGINKIFRAQFPEPPLARLIDPLGQTSPMGMLWTFMGLSRAYSTFGGMGEVLGGLLILIPRFVTLGSLVTIGVMSNVLMLNLAYDVPRKIYSIHLILIAAFLLLPDLRRLINVFILNRPAAPAREYPLFAEKRWNRGVLAFQIAYAIFALVFAGSQAHADQVHAANHLQAPLRGIWEVDDFDLGGTSHPPLTTDKDRWRYVVFDSPDLLSVQYMDATLQQYYLVLDQNNDKLRFSELGTNRWKATLGYELTAPDRITMTGLLDGQTFTAHLQRLDLSDPHKFLLINRGFHWVNDFPYRR